MANLVEWDITPTEQLPNLLNVAKVAEDLAISFFGEVIKRTPVLTGSLRASWRISVGSPDLSVTTGGRPGNPLPAPSIPTSLGLSFSTEYPTIYITNSQPYADYINNGTPTHAGVHMVELSLMSVTV